MFNEVFNVFLIGFIIVVILLMIIFLVAKARKHPLYHKAKETEDTERKDIIMKVVHDTIVDYTSSKEYYDKIDKILEKHLSQENIKKTILEVTEKLKKEGKIDKDFTRDKAIKKGDNNEIEPVRKSM